ncbi:hypothetical protein EUGRSUZ_B01064 [Eucalyptus grandis]|uniref:TIR domain-containing protein n=2 Tax=Eucalyptus grandis TaxID=71139 RepID=A0A059D140_EUCGR|nr:hypothetical protein EUGRSUZ_B01064 [Eucalyptus grandis]
MATILVFLSFRGEDTRKTITDHLYSRLVDAGIDVFRDSENLHAGEEIKPQLIDAIKGSKISIAVFSKDYASSKSCLMEVVQMWECRKSNGQIIIPIFYDISPYDVKRQAGYFGRSFEKHVKDGLNADVKKWREVFRKIGGLSGFNLNGGHESQLVKGVFSRVCQVLKKDDQVVPDKLVGIDLHVQEVMRKLGVAYSDGQAIQVCGQDRRVVGICGMLGVGKTTLAKVVYNKMHMLFEECSFLEGINSRKIELSQEMLIASLQKRKPEALNSSDDGIKKMNNLFRNMKVLIVLDDVHNDGQIKALAEKLTWFGPGSRIIVTTEITNVLNDFEDGAVEKYKVGAMENHHALQLFRKHAFRKHAFQGRAPQGVSEYDSLSIDIVKAIGGLPLAIILQASYLRNEGEDLDIWRSTLEFLRRHPPDGVKHFLDRSFESLNDDTKQIFLDIACFFIGKDKRIPSYMWEACEYYPPRGIKHLCNLHLLEDGEHNELRMHGLIRDFGRDIVERKGRCERCRFWNHSDALSLLKNRTGTESVQGICLTFEESRPDCFTFEEFQPISNLRYLRLDRANIQGDTGILLPKLRWLDWRACHLISELSILHLEELVILDLSWSPVTKDSPDREQIMKKVEKLKVLNLQGCVQLCASLDFSAPVNLEILILEGCTLLTQIKPFISNLKNLRSLNLKGCTRVMELPDELYCMESMRELVIDGTGIQCIGIHCQSDILKNLETLSACNCTCLQDISKIGCLSHLSSLALDGANIDGLPDTFEFPQKLKRLSLRECRKLVKLPPSIGKLNVLELMDLSGTGIKVLPRSVKKLTELKTLKMAHTFLQKFPEGVAKLAKLEEIDFSFCRSLEGRVRCDISKLSSLRILRLSSSDVAELPRSISRLSRLQTLDIIECNQLHTLPKLPSSLLHLRWGSTNVTVPNLSYLTNLKVLLLTDGEQPKAGWLTMLLNLMTPNIGWITRLQILETLQLSISKVTYLPQNFSALTQLRELTLSYMKELDLSQLPSSSLSSLRLKHCKIRKPKICGRLSELELKECDLAEIDGLEELKLLEVLKISHCRSITNLNGLKDLPRLRKVEGTFSARPSLPKFSHPVELDIFPRDPSE